MASSSLMKEAFATLTAIERSLRTDLPIVLYDPRDYFILGREQKRNHLLNS